MADPALPLTGENVVVKIYLDNQPFPESDTVDSMSVTEDAAIHKDPYLGRKRNRLDKQVNNYDCNISSDMTGTRLLAAIFVQDQKREANQPVPELSLEVQLKQRDGQIKAVVLSKGVAKWDLKVGSRTERAKLGLDMTFEDVIPVAV